ncbi:Down syndrome cell adhesion molecule-like protein 1 [Nymphon striatum]|nr:Down syndrome cell adhesion molecule-like protein 1 [Nymphon striatum]
MSFVNLTSTGNEFDILFILKTQQYMSTLRQPHHRCISDNMAFVNCARRFAVEQHYQVQVYNDYVIRGNTGVLKCQIPSYVKDYVSVTSWMRDDGLQIEDATNSGEERQ